jgi:hypothetical protein
MGKELHVKGGRVNEHIDVFLWNMQIHNVVVIPSIHGLPLYE